MLNPRLGTPEANRNTSMIPLHGHVARLPVLTLSFNFPALFVLSASLDREIPASELSVTSEPVREEEREMLLLTAILCFWCYVFRFFCSIDTSNFGSYLVSRGWSAAGCSLIQEHSKRFRCTSAALQAVSS